MTRRRDPALEQDYRDEAERMAQLPPADQREIIALHRSVADNPKVAKRDRALAKERADAIERHLRRLKHKSK